MIQWGVLGLGNIAQRFLASLSHSKRGCVRAIASRTAHKREAYRGQNPAGMIYETYEALLADRAIDAVYIALPHGLHKKWSIAALQQRKAVLCEKPAGLNSAEMMEIMDAARANQCFFMEAMKTRFVPMTEKLKRDLVHGVIGEIHEITANFCSNIGDKRPAGWYLFDPQQGGALLDVGPYPIAFALDIANSSVSQVEAQLKMREGVDVHFGADLTFDNGIIAHVEGALDEAKERTAVIQGSLGTITVPVYNRPTSYVLHRNGQVLDITCPLVHDDMIGEIEAVHTSLLAGDLEHELFSWEDSLQVLRVMDSIRKGITK